jgi:hypothetical protein
MSAIKNASIILVPLIIAFSSGGGCAQSDDARGGYIFIIDFDTSSSTDYWYGYYGSVIPASENPYRLDTETRIQEIDINRTGGCLLITDSQDVPNPAYLIAGNPATIDAITGTGYDSGSRTFTETVDYTIYDRILPAPTAYTFGNCSESTFKEGFFTEPGKDNLVFIVPVVESGTCYNAMPCNFQFILPNNPVSPMTYYIYYIPAIPPTEPSAISLTADPGIIEADGTTNSTITATVTDESGEMVNGTKVTFNTTLGNITPLTAVTVNGTTTTILTSSTSPGTAVVEGTVANKTSVTQASTPEALHDTVHIPFIRTGEAGCDGTLENVTVTVMGTGVSVADTTVTIKDGAITITTTRENATLLAGTATAGMVISIPIKGGTLEITLEDDATTVANTFRGNISKIRLNTPPEEYITSRTEVGTASVDLDVEFQGTVTPYRGLSFKTTLVERYGDLRYLNVSDTCRLKEMLADYFGVDTSTIANNTPILVYSKLSATDLTRSEVTGVPISITLNKDWFDTVAGGDPGNVVLFKINETTGEIEGDITMIPESITITGNRVTFRATFDHFSVFAIITRLPASIPHKGGGGGTYPPVLTVTPTITPTLTPTPVEPTVVAVGTLTPTPTVAAAWAAPEEKPGQEEWSYPTRIILLAIAAGIFIIFILWRSRNDGG